MKFNRKSIGVKLWLYFILFTGIILGALWLLQTVFLQRFYNSMEIGNVRKVAEEIAAGRDSENLTDIIDKLAYTNSVLIFLTDWEGNVLYSIDDYSFSYEENAYWHSENEDSEKNPYIIEGEVRNWQKVAFRNLPNNYDSFLQKLSNSEDGRVCYQIDNTSPIGSVTLVYGMVIPVSDSKTSFLGDGEAVIYISTPLGAVSSTVAILQTQFFWITLASIFIGLVIAFFMARRFSRPIAALTQQAKHIATGDFKSVFEKSFCSELDELGAALEQTAHDLSCAENLRRELLANISHDLRTPLTMIKGYAEMVHDLSWEDEETRKKDLKIIMREADRLTSLVNDILDYSVLQSGRGFFEFEILNISVLVQEAAQQFALIFEKDDVHIKASIDSGQYVCGDSKRLEQVLYNLICNAVSHVGADRTVCVSLTNRSTVVRVEICDHGEGIPPDELPYIWDRYFTSRQRKRSGIGTGLGLSIVKEVLTAHKSKFGVDSELGQGSVFWFELDKQIQK